jgi:hypothetical protein
MILRFKQYLANGCGGGNAIPQDNIRPQRLSLRDCLSPIRRLTDDLSIRVTSKKDAQTFMDDTMIIRTHTTNGHLTDT